MSTIPTPFISYAREDGEFAARLCADLKLAGAAPWLDREQLIGGEDWASAITRALQTSTHFVAVMSTRSVGKKGFVQKELRRALDLLEEFPPGHVFLVPVRLDDCQSTHLQLTRLQRIDFFPNYRRGFEGLVRSLGLNPPPVDARDMVLSSWGSLRQAGDVPPDVDHVIVERALRDFPNNRGMQTFRCDNERRAWCELKAAEYVDIPVRVINTINACAILLFPRQFARRLYYVRSEVAAWRELAALSVPVVPAVTVVRLVETAEQEEPASYVARLLRVRALITEWLITNA